MSNGLRLNSSTSVGGLGTQSFTVVDAGPYVCEVNFTIPYRAVGSQGDSSSTVGASDLSIVVNQDDGGGDDAMLTIENPSSSQPSMAGKVNLYCAAGDIISVVLSSSAVADNARNAVKGIVNLYQGE